MSPTLVTRQYRLGDLGDKSTKASIETFVLDLVRPLQRKVAFIIGCAMVEQGFDQFDVAEVIYTMCVKGQLKHYGDIVNWRNSEVGLPDED